MSSTAAPREYDVVIATDGRLPGGTVATVAEEIAAQHRAGYRTGFAHIDSPLVGYPRPFNPRLARLVEDGAVDVLVGDRPVHARLAVVRHPSVLTTPQLRLPPIVADQRLVIANQTPRDAQGRHVYYDVEAVEAAARTHLGGPPRWATIGPLVREQFSQHAPDIELMTPDWVNVIDVATWGAPRTGLQGERPVIGRHSRDHRAKWPATRDELLAAYPPDPDLDVRILGGAEQAARVVGQLPANWTAYPFGSMRAERFLAGIDFFVYYHHPAWVEAFGRAILEAMASGAVAILPPHFQQLFGDAPVYTAPRGVRDAVRSLHRDPEAFLERSRRGQSFAAEHFGYDTHARRVESLIGPPSERRVAVTTPSSGAMVPDDARTRVLFVSSNGVGVGHLMRLMAMARRASDDVVPLVLTLSQAVSVVRQNGFFVEYLPSRNFTDMSFRDWHALLRDRLDDLIRTHDVRAVVFDGTWPYRGLLEAKLDHPEVTFVWSRRGMWREGMTAPQLASAEEFDLIVEPGEFARAFDHGPTSQRREETTEVGPVTFLDADELVDRAAARAELGLDPDRPAALVQLGAGNINDVGSVLQLVTERLLAEPDLQVCVTSSIIADRAEGSAADIVTIRGVYPLAKYFAAFDFAVTASGYNSFHESLVAGLPTIFVPNLQTSADDQGARSLYAEAVGVGRHLPVVDAASVDIAVRTMMDGAARDAMAAEARRRAPGNGAEDAMRAIEQALGIGSGPAPDRATSDTDPAPPSREAAAVARATATAVPAATATTDADAGAAAAGSSVPVAGPGATTPGATTLGEATPDATIPGATTVGEATPDATIPGATTVGAPIGDAGTAAAVAPAPLVGVPPASQRVRRARNRLRRAYRNARAEAARTVQSPQVRAVARTPFRALPRDTQAAVRRRLRRWERHAAVTVRSQRVAADLRLTVPPGPLLAEADLRDRLPGVLFVLPDATDADEHARLVERIAELQVVHRSFAPLVVTFHDDLSPYRHLGLVPELVASRELWGRVQPTDRYDDYFQGRLSHLMATWDVDQVIVLGSVDGLSGERVASLALGRSRR